MSKNANYIGQPIFSQLLKFLPRDKISTITRESKSDHYVKRFMTYDHLVTMLYSSFHNCRSLREVTTGMMACYGKLRHLGLNDCPKRSTLSDANRRRDSGVFEKIYHELYSSYRSVLSDSQNRGLLDRRLFIVDSTTISLFQEVLKNAGRTAVNGKRKGGIKAHVLIKASEDIPCLVSMTSAAAHDAPFLERISLPRDSILVFDKGYRSFAQYERLSREGITWVSRKHHRSSIEVTGHNAIDAQQGENGVTGDRDIILGNTINKAQLRVEARLIAFHDSQTGKDFEFITNNRAMKASTIAQLYQRRWQIETLFKRLKQNNQLTYFLGDNENAIRIQIWCSLIADLIIKVIQASVRRSWSFANLSSMIRIHLMSYTSLLTFLEDPERSLFDQKDAQQLNLFSSA